MLRTQQCAAWDNKSQKRRWILPNDHPLFFLPLSVAYSYQNERKLLVLQMSCQNWLQRGMRHKIIRKTKRNNNKQKKNCLVLVRYDGFCFAFLVFFYFLLRRRILAAPFLAIWRALSVSWSATLDAEGAVITPPPPPPPKPLREKPWTCESMVKWWSSSLSLLVSFLSRYNWGVIRCWCHTHHTSKYYIRSTLYFVYTSKYIRSIYAGGVFHTLYSYTQGAHVNARVLECRR